MQKICRFQFSECEHKVFNKERAIFLCVAIAPCYKPTYNHDNKMQLWEKDRSKGAKYGSKDQRTLE